MKTVVFTDLDETLLCSRRRRVPESEDILAAVDKDGRPVSYQSKKQGAFFKLIQGADRLIAVTGRSASAYGRVCLPFVHEAIVHHGAMILGSEGNPDSEYAKQINGDLRSSDHLLQNTWARTQQMITLMSAPLRIYRQILNETTIEVCVKHVDPSEVSLGNAGKEIFDSWCDLGDDVRVHWNGNNLALLPRRVDKLRAVSWLSARLEQRIGPFLTIAAGDSNTDHPFMSACDFYIVPSGSQIDSQLIAFSGSDGGDDARI